VGSKMDILLGRIEFLVSSFFISFLDRVTIAMLGGDRFCRGV